MTRGSKRPDVRVVLYTKPDCSLCDDARDLLAELGIDVVEAVDITYADRVPVIAVDGRIVAEGRVSKWGLRRAIRRAGRAR